MNEEQSIQESNRAMPFVPDPLGPPDPEDTSPSDQRVVALEAGINAAVEEVRTLTGEDLTSMAQTPVVAGSEAVKDTRPRTCVIEQALPISVIQLLQAAPHNETVRAVVLAHVKVPIPKELSTFEDIKEWIETTIVKGAPKGVVRAVDSSGYPLPPSNRNQITFDITGEEVDYGTCRYQVRNIGGIAMPIPLGEFQEMMSSADDLEDLKGRLSDYISEHWLDEISMDTDSDGHEYNNHESTGTEDSDWSYDCNVDQRLTQLVREYGDDDARERLI